MTHKDSEVVGMPRVHKSATTSSQPRAASSSSSTVHGERIGTAMSYDVSFLAWLTSKETI